MTNGSCVCVNKVVLSFSVSELTSIDTVVEVLNVWNELIWLCVMATMSTRRYERETSLP